MQECAAISSSPPYPVRMRSGRYGLAALVGVAGLALGYASSAASSGGTTTTAPAPPATTAVTTTAAAVATTSATSTTPAQPATPSADRDLDRGCLAVAGAALWLPGHPLPLVVGPAVHAPWAKRPARTSLVYPADGSVISAISGALRGSACADGGVQLQTLSLFDGAVTVDSVVLRVDGGGVDDASAVSGLRIDGAIVATPAPGARLPLGSWGYLEVLRSNAVKVRPPGASAKAARVRATGLVVHLLERRDGVPAGTDVQVAVADFPAPPPPAPATTTTTTTKTTTGAAAPAKAVPPRASAPRAAAARPGATRHVLRRARSRHRKAGPAPPTHEPLTVTPPLGQKRFLFPVAGPVSYGDTYGGLRTDVSGDWHHGDDLFARLGTPVVAVASGTLNRVGWERLGGWRLWVRDASGDEFYYAHLSGYTPLALRSKKVRAGEVLGFVGNSGDAYPSTPPHLHFEIHPRSLLRLQYDGAVDPTTYLDQWHHVERVRAPRPVLPRIAALPSAAVKQEARVIFRELLSDRGLTPKVVSFRQARPAAPPPVEHHVARHAAPRRVATAALLRRSSFDPLPLAFVVLAAAVLASAGLLHVRHVRARRRFFAWLDSIASGGHTD